MSLVEDALTRSIEERLEEHQHALDMLLAIKDAALNGAE
jgi:hypothetical protein